MRCWDEPFRTRFEQVVGGVGVWTGTHYMCQIITFSNASYYYYFYILLFLLLLLLLPLLLLHISANYYYCSCSYYYIVLLQMLEFNG